MAGRAPDRSRRVFGRLRNSVSEPEARRPGAPWGGAGDGLSRGDVNCNDDRDAKHEMTWWESDERYT